MARTSSSMPSHSALRTPSPPLETEGQLTSVVSAAPDKVVNQVMGLLPPDTLQPVAHQRRLATAGWTHHQMTATPCSKGRATKVRVQRLDLVQQTSQSDINYFHEDRLMV